VDCRQVEEVAHRRRLEFVERVQQAQQGALHHVIGVGPSLDVRKALEHPAGEVFHPPADAAQQLIARRQVARLKAFDPMVELRRLKRRVGHRPTSSHSGTDLRGG
jgi:hypothetical protein